jgi:PAS domain S-box-containing protein
MDHTGGTRKGERRLQHADGSWRYVEAIGYNLLHDPAVEGVVINIRDITERKKAEEELRQRERDFSTMVENATDMIVRFDTDLRYVYCNRAVERQLGIPTHTLIGKTGVEVDGSREQVEFVDKSLRKALETGDEQEVEQCLPLPSGTKHFLTRIVPERDEQGRIESLLAITRDITKRKKAEEALRVSEEKFSTAFDASPAMMVIISLKDSRYVEVNMAYERLTGYGRDEVVGHTFSEVALWSDAKEVEQAFLNLHIVGVHPKQEVQFHNKTGESRVVLLSIEAVEFGGERCVLMAAEDITDIKMAEIRQRRTHEQLILSSRLASLGRLASGVAHEINNPLSVVIGYSQILMEKDVPEGIKEDLQAINDSAERVAGVVKGLLAFGRQSKPGKEYVDINALVSRTLGLRAHEMNIHNIEVATKLAPDLPWTMADAGQIQQVFLNIILNAEQAMTRSNKDGHLLVKTGQTGDRITITFRDDGIGIPKKYLPRLFDPFFTTKGVGEGTGLGLSISYGIIQEHNGRIYAKGQPGKGATFVVELPIVAKPDQPESPAKPAGEPKEKVIGRILVVDDEPAICQLLRDLLTRDGHNVETVGDAGVALERVKHERFSLILLDIRMKGMNGIELYQQMGKIAPALQGRVVLITGDTLAPGTRDFLEKTRAPHICKPFDIRELRKMISRVLWSEG